MSVLLREKKLSSGKISLYLDIYHNGKRYYDFLRLYITKDRAANKEIKKLAESIRSKRELEIQNSDHGFIPQFKKKINFVEYFEKLTKEKNRDDWLSTLKHLKGTFNSFSSQTDLSNSVSVIKI